MASTHHLAQYWLNIRRYRSGLQGHTVRYKNPASTLTPIVAKMTAAITRRPAKLHTRRIYSSGGSFVADLSVGLEGPAACVFSTLL
eukprot:CAMPEP_0205920790 /NCGR_PEP_ID=MMETSP1325-20131115/11755_1 /ASSEMBLY_ACC=CAM_ASM_000708 /TAXON_ID=236786 /ORGANISM="Florenciella sp., Strain RCC1007" /LENGTH=85 /DNA_ID=CAMNT_0053288515 /DNA_START=50 /DNA_END=307 /DNA_ORIENTATION=-